MPNWLDGERVDRLKVQCVDPTDLGHVGWLSVTGATLTEGYYTDTRVQGSVTAVDPDQYVPQSMIRLIHEADFADGVHYRRVLGTFFAIRSREVWKGGSLSTEFELKSTLYGMSRDYAPRDMLIAADSRTRSAFEAICSRCARRRSWVDGANDRRFARNRILDAGDSYLSWLHQLAGASGNRLDVDERGYVTMEGYTAPSKRAAGFRLAYSSPLVLSAGIERKSDEMDLPSRAIVTWEHEYETSYQGRDGSSQTRAERRTVTAYADVDEGSPAHIGRRGFRVSTWNDMDDLGDSNAAAQEKARELLEEQSHPTTTWEVSTRWWEVYEGDVLMWRPSEGEHYRKVIVTGADKDLFSFTIRLSLKEV